MDAGDFIAAASALVAAAAATVGWWQAHSARRAVETSEAQVNVMRDQLALERSLRDDSLKPRFEITHAATMQFPGNPGRLSVEIAQTSGVPLDDVQVELYAGSRQIAPDEATDTVYSAPGSKITVRAHLDAGIAQTPAIRIELSGTEARGIRQWSERLVAHPTITVNRLLPGTTTPSGLPRRVPKANLAPGSSDPAGGPQVSRAPDDVRSRLSNLRRRIEQGRNVTGDERKDQGSGPDRTQKPGPDRTQKQEP